MENTNVEISIEPQTPGSEGDFDDDLAVDTHTVVDLGGGSQLVLNREEDENPG